jgi:hypothetical protein
MTAPESFCGILLLSSAFVAAKVCRRYTVRIKRRWEALSGGVAIAYVFVNVIPEIEAHREVVAGSAYGTLLDAEKKIYLWALTGFVVFAGLTRLRFVQEKSGVPPHSGLVYRGAMAGWSAYMLLIGYLLLHHEGTSLLSLVLFVFAMGLHIFMVDNELTDRFEGLYEPFGRRLLMFGLWFGWALGMVDALPDAFTSRLFAFVMGGVAFTSAHEELPVEESGRFWWFAGGAAAYGTLLMLI